MIQYQLSNGKWTDATDAKAEHMLNLVARHNGLDSRDEALALLAEGPARRGTDWYQVVRLQQEPEPVSEPQTLEQTAGICSCCGYGKYECTCDVDTSPEAPAPNGDDMSDTINTHFADWNDDINLTRDRAVLAGFVAFAYDVAQETRTQLADDDTEQLALDVTYSVVQAGETITEEQASEWLTRRRADLIAALDEAIAGK